MNFSTRLLLKKEKKRNFSFSPLNTNNSCVVVKRSLNLNFCDASAVLPLYSFTI